MPKPIILENMVQDLKYIASSTYVHDFLFQVAPPHRGMMVLEPGCGSAKFALAYALKECVVVALDIDSEVIDYAGRLRRALKELVGDFYMEPLIDYGNVKHLNFTDNFFDLVFNEGVPQHWPDDETRQHVINEMTRVSHDKVVIIGNDGGDPMEREIDRNFNFTYQDMPPKRRCFTIDELGTKMQAAGLKNVKVAAIGALIAGVGSKQ